MFFLSVWRVSPLGQTAASFRVSRVGINLVSTFWFHIGQVFVDQISIIGFKITITTFTKRHLCSPIKKGQLMS